MRQKLHPCSGLLQLQRESVPIDLGYAFLTLSHDVSSLAHLAAEETKARAPSAGTVSITEPPDRAPVVSSLSIEVPSGIFLEPLGGIKHLNIPTANARNKRPKRSDQRTGCVDRALKRTATASTAKPWGTNFGLEHSSASYVHMIHRLCIRSNRSGSGLQLEHRFAVKWCNILLRSCAWR